MPRPPILKEIDWNNVFSRGVTYSDWLAAAENTEHRDLMQQDAGGIKVIPAIREFLESLPRPVHVVAIAEDWCGDVIRHVPVLERIAEIGSNVHTRYITREAFPEVFVRFLTNGGEAIPKFVFLSEDFVECGNWGPMPAQCRALIARGKACNDVGKARELVSAAYDADEEREVVVKELAECIDVAVSLDPNPRDSLLMASMKKAT